MDESKTKLGSEKIGKLLLKFSIPCIISLLISSLYNIVDQIFIGNSDIGYLGNTATTIVFPITILAVAFAWCFGDGAAAYLSIAQGKKDTQKTHKAAGNSIAASFIISIIFMIVCLAARDPILYLFGASAQSIGLAREYFVIIVAAIPVYMIANTMNSIIRADGSPAFSMASMLIGAIINIILDPIFIFVLKWGIAGAAWATIIGQIVSFVISSAYFFFKSKNFKLKWKSFLLDPKVFFDIIKLGFSTFITQFSIVIIALVCNIILNQYGQNSIYGPDIPIAVIGIAMKVFTIVINIVVGIILGAQPILGYNYGAGKYDRVKKTLGICLLASVIVGIVATILFQACPEIVISLFGTGSELYLDFARKTFRIFLMFVTFTCIIKMSSIFFQSIGQPIKSAIISLIRDIVCFVPLVIIMPMWMGIDGALWAAPIADAVGMLLTGGLLFHFIKSIRKKMLVAQPPTEMKNIQPSAPGYIITISRQHGSQGKYIGKLVADKLGIPYYYKEMTALAAQESGLAEEFISKLNEQSPNVLFDLYLSSNPVQYALEAQAKVIQEIAAAGSCVIVGRAADAILAKHENLISIFIHAPKEYRLQKVMEMYGDTLEEAIKNVEKSDKTRGKYYKYVSDLEWGDARHYDLCVDSSIGAEEAAAVILEYLDKRKEKSCIQNKENAEVITASTEEIITDMK